jgi:CheY-like chemotaxis protein
VNAHGEYKEEFRILVADDEPHICELLAMLLGGSGYPVETTSSGPGAIERIAAGAPSIELLIADNNMPGMTGVELTAKLRGERGYRGKVMIISGETAADLHETYAELGVSRTLEKPVDIGALLGAIEAIQADLQIGRASAGGLN